MDHSSKYHAPLIKNHVPLRSPICPTWDRWDCLWNPTALPHTLNYVSVPSHLFHPKWYTVFWWQSWTECSKWKGAGLTEPTNYYLLPWSAGERRIADSHSALLPFWMPPPVGRDTLTRTTCFLLPCRVTWPKTTKITINKDKKERKKNRVHILHSQKRFSRSSKFLYTCSSRTWLISRDGVAFIKLHIPKMCFRHCGKQERWSTVI